MLRNKYILSGVLLLAIIVFLNCGRSLAVVPYPPSMEKKLGVRTKEERLLEIIKKIEKHGKENIEFYRGIESELKQIFNKEGVGNEG